MNVLAVGAHFDDIELGCGGSLINYSNAGHNVVMLVICNSAYKNPDGAVVRNAAAALAEGTKAAGIINAELVHFNHETFMVDFNEELTCKILNIIEKFNIDTIFSHWNHDIHRDHQNVAKATIMAGRHVPRFLMYQSNYYDTEVSFHPNFYSDISSVIKEKFLAVEAHTSEMKRVKNRWIDYFTNQHKNNGCKAGVDFAEAFQVLRYLI